MTRHAFAILLSVFLFRASPAFAVTPDEMLADPQLEARARHVSKELRCVVCQNQSIDDSNAPLAHDMRVIVRERIVAGDSDEEVKAFLVNRYGEFVLLRPRVKAETALLWFGPFLLLIVAGGAFWIYVAAQQRGRPAEDAPSLSEAELRRVEKIREDLAT